LARTPAEQDNETIGEVGEKNNNCGLEEQMNTEEGFIKKFPERQQNVKNVGLSPICLWQFTFDGLLLLLLC